MTPREFWRKLRYFFRREQFNRDLDDEIRLHIDLRAKRQAEAGSSSDDAAWSARRKFGNRALLQEDSRGEWEWRPIEEMRQDLRYATRMLLRTPAFTSVAILSLALGIGANTAIFSLIDAVLLKTLPVERPQELRVLTWSGDVNPMRSYDGYGIPDPKTGKQRRGSFSYPVYQMFAGNVTQFSQYAGFAESDFSVTVDGQTEVAPGTFVTSTFFPMLGVIPIAGRPITEADDAPGKPYVAVISYSYWEKRFGLDPGVIGKRIAVNQKPVTIIGVLPRDFLGSRRHPRAPFRYLRTGQLRSGTRTEVPFACQCRVLVAPANSADRPGVPDREAAGALTAVLANMSRSHPNSREVSQGPPQAHVSAGDAGIQWWFRRRITPRLYTLATLVGLILLIACVNLANLLLARSSARRREIAVRLSIGASKWRLVRQLMAESLLLSGAGGLIGVALAAPLANLVLRMVSGSDTASLNASLDTRTLAFTFFLSLATGLLFGTIPALRATRVDLTPALKNAGSTAGASLPSLRLSRVLVAGQVALSVLLLVSAGLFVRTLISLVTTDLGFSEQHVLTFRADASRSGYAGARLVEAYGRMRDALAGIPGVESVAMSNHGLIAQSSRTDGVYIPGYAAKPGEDRGSHILICSSSFLSTMRIPVIAGRDLSAADETGGRRSVVVNEAFVRKFFPGMNPIGQTFYFGGRPEPGAQPMEIVGVARNARYTQVKGEYPPTAYHPYTVKPVSVHGMTFAVRTSLPPASLGVAVRRAVAGIDSAIPVAQMRTQEEQVSRHLATERLFAGLVSSLGFIAALLAAIGLYGVMAYTMMRRTVEIGIRTALGATRSHVQWLVVRDGILMVIAGLVVGAPAALGVTKLFRDQLYGVKPNDALSFAAAMLVMVAIAALAAYIPARRAARVDPLIALKYE